MVAWAALTSADQESGRLSLPDPRPAREPRAFVILVMSSIRQVTDSLDVVPVRVAHKGPEVVLVVLGKHPGFVEDFGSRGRRCVVKFDDLVAIGGLEGHMYLTGFALCRHRAEPELRPALAAEPDHLSEVQHALVAQGG